MADHDQPAIFFLNALFLQKDTEFPKEESHNAVQNSLGFNSVRGISPESLAKLLTENVAATKLAMKSPHTIQQKFQEMGVQAEIENIYRKGSFVALKVTVVLVDAKLFLEHRMGSFSQVCGLFTSCMKPEETGKPEQMLPALMQLSSDSLPQQLAEDGCHVEVIAKTTEEQSDFIRSVAESLGSSQDRSCSPPNNLCSLQ